MERSIRKYDSFDAIKADDYREWQGRPAHERMRAVAEITLAAYRLKERE